MMKKALFVSIMLIIGAATASCNSCSEERKKEVVVDDGFTWVIDRFDDVKIIKYRVPGFDNLPLQEKMFIYYMSQSALCGRDILFDQNFRYNLPIRRTLEEIYENYDGDKKNPDWLAFEIYLKKVWFANGIHHHYSGAKFTAEFSEIFFDEQLAKLDEKALPQNYGTKEDLAELLKPIIFDPSIYALRMNQREGVDLLQTSAMNYYEGVTQAEAVKFYEAKKDKNNPEPVLLGLNSKLVKKDGVVVEEVWKIGGMYSPALENVVYWLNKATEVANDSQRAQVDKLIEYYQSGDLKAFDDYNVMWVKDTESTVDFINGFTEVYGDPLGYKASWESMVHFKDEESNKRAKTIGENAQWFEDNSPIDNRFKKEEVKGVSASVVNVAMLGGDCYPATPIGVNLPNSDWIRKDHGSKSITIQNITHAYSEADKGSGFLEEFMLRKEDRERAALFGTTANNLHIDLHECLGHGSGKLAPGVSGDELLNYGSTLEETRADLFSLYYIADPKLIELGIVATTDIAKAEYAHYIMNGMMTQLTRIKMGDNVEQAHMRNRKLIAEWSYELGKKDNVIEIVVENGKTYVIVNDFDKLREIFGVMLKEIQRIKSTGDFKAGKKLIEKYSVKIDPVLHAEILERYESLDMEPYSGFVNPIYQPLMEGGEIKDIIIEYPESYVKQMMEYSKAYSFLPSKN